MQQIPTRRDNPGTQESKGRLVVRGAHRPILVVEDRGRSLPSTTAVRIWASHSPRSYRFKRCVVCPLLLKKKDFLQIGVPPCRAPLPFLSGFEFNPENPTLLIDLHSC